MTIGSLWLPSWYIFLYPVDIATAVDMKTRRGNEDNDVHMTPGDLELSVLTAS